MRSTLYRNGVIHAATDPLAQAVLVADGRIAWLGREDAVHTVLDGVDDVVDLDGALVTPGFVDAHAHVLETGFALAGVNLSAAAGITSLRLALDAVATAARTARAAGGDAPLLGHGWDETGWPEGRPPDRAELDRVTGGAPVYLARADVHSAVVSTSFARVAGCDREPGWSDDGLVTGPAHHRAREAARDVGPQRRGELHLVALAAAAAAGIVSLHEHSAPYVDTRAGLADLLDRTHEPSSGLPGVVGYRAELCRTSDDARALIEAIPGLSGVGGDLNVDGSIGSRTAALRAPYVDLDRDDPSSSGALQLSAEEVANHVAAVTRAGAQAAFHVIGDRAMDEVLLGFQAAAEVEGLPALRAAGHRIEHAEMVDARALATLVLLGLTVSVQPAFDAAWGGAEQMYARRLGAGRAAGMNPFADLLGAGVPLAFGSDAPVTPFDPWGAVRAAIAHHERGQRISARDALHAHTVGGWHAAGRRDPGRGELAAGAPASLAVWRVDRLTPPEAHRADPRTGPEAGDPPLPVLGPDVSPPVCLRTVRDGVVLFDALG